VETFEVSLLKTKGIPASNALNCEGWAKICAALRIENVYHTAKSHYGVGADGRA
jgi:hypothetical protein